MKDPDPNLIRLHLRQELKRLILEKFEGQSHFAEVCQLPEPKLSKILNGKQFISLDELDTMTEALGLPKGYFYQLFIGECFRQTDGRLYPEKCAQFIRKCLEQGKDGLAHELFALTLESKSKSGYSLFIQAEEFYHSFSEADLLPYYEEIIEVEGRITDLMVIAYYRRFLLQFQKGIGWRVAGALYNLLPYINLLPEQYTEITGKTVNLKLDAYRQVLHYFQQVEEWDELLHYAKEMERWSIQAENDQAYCEAMHYQFQAKNKLENMEQEAIRSGQSERGNTGTPRMTPQDVAV
ncbi:helix-turn-helix domain-containing protein [Brevibacillus dissolubilis]|uniref:helix-turn-helix domain-containing protein n=1 Tax=Brevibacillus dissolubilis TaxID=1844116 RepID=UPI001115FB4D|nr:helix-turn-helix transcriptional regulator [Brevibacillus dissolubilis]